MLIDEKDPHISITMVHQLLPDVACHVRLEWLLACHKSQTASELLGGIMGRFAHPLFISFCRKIFTDKFACRDAGYCDRPFYHG